MFHHHPAGQKDGSGVTVKTRVIIALAFPLFTSCTQEVDFQLVTAARAGKAARVRTLLDSGADANAMNLGGWTALAYSAAQGHSETVDALLDAGADVDRSNRDAGKGLTPLTYAARGGHRVTAQILLEAGADVNAQRGGMTALKMATSRGHTSMVQLPQDAGARE